MERSVHLLILIATLLLASASPAPAGEGLKESATGVLFPLTSDDGLQLLGVGVRKKLVFNVYAGALYVDADGLAKAVGDKGAKGANKAVHRGRFQRRMLLHFVRDVPAAKIREAFKDSLVHNMSKEDFAAEEKNIEEFLESCTDVKKGQVFQFESRNDRVVVKLAGRTTFDRTSRRLVVGMWGSYFGKRPVDDSLRKGLLRRAAELLGAQQ